MKAKTTPPALVRGKAKFITVFCPQCGARYSCFKEDMNSPCQACAKIKAYEAGLKKNKNEQE